MHPTVKPVALVEDAFKDVSKRKGIALDPFCGSGTTIIAAEKTGRRARAVELEPKFVDVAVRRWERYTGKTAVLEAIGQTFDDVEAARCGERQRRGR
jgi:DNA modification methylase